MNVLLLSESFWNTVLKRDRSAACILMRTEDSLSEQDLILWTRTRQLRARRARTQRDFSGWDALQAPGETGHYVLVHRQTADGSESPIVSNSCCTRPYLTETTLFYSLTNSFAHSEQVLSRVVDPGSMFLPERYSPPSPVSSTVRTCKLG